MEVPAEALVNQRRVASSARVRERICVCHALDQVITVSSYVDLQYFIYITFLLIVSKFFIHFHRFCWISVGNDLQPSINQSTSTTCWSSSIQKIWIFISIVNHIVCHCYALSLNLHRVNYHLSNSFLLPPSLSLPSSLSLYLRTYTYTSPVGIDKVNGNIFERWTCNTCKGFGLVSCSCTGEKGLTPEQRYARTYGV